MSALPPIHAFALGRLPRITFGEGSFARVPDLAAAYGSRLLLVTGGRSLAASGRRAELIDAFRAAGLVVAGEVIVTEEPSPTVVDEAVGANRDAGVEVVVGVGGGSVLDAAKAIAGLLRTGTSVRDHLEGVGPELPYPGPAVPFVAVPTTAGTGSEASRNAVISERGEGGYKRSFRDERLVAADAVVDPDLLAGSDPARIAANGMDALTQLLESYVSLRASPVTDALALAGMDAARDGLLAWHADPDGPGAALARSRMALASLLSGICLANAGLGAVHGLASPLGALLPIPHGVACGATLAPVTAANIVALERDEPDSAALVRYAELGRRLSSAPGSGAAASVAYGSGGSGVAVAARRALVATLEAWTSGLAIPRLATFGLDDATIPAVVAGARGSSMRTNPVVLTDEELVRILQAAA